MYESFYGLRTKPFALLPDGESLYPGSTHRTAYSLLEYGLLNEAPFMVLTGEPGMGKTSLLRKLIAEHHDKYSIGFVTNARYDVEHLLPWFSSRWASATNEWILWKPIIRFQNF